MRMQKKWALGFVSAMLFIGLLKTTAWAEERLFSGFNAGSLDLWSEKAFEGETDYQLVELDGQKVLRASSDQSASGLFLERTIDLTKTPYLSWRWRVDQGPEGLLEESKAGDDYAARIYLVKKGGAFFWRTRALNYVWSSRPVAGKNWPNAYAGDNVQMLALRGSSDSKGVWQTERRNVREDFKRLFGEDIEQIDAIAIMTDSDNTGSDSLSYYGDLVFSAN